MCCTKSKGALELPGANCWADTRPIGNAPMTIPIRRAAIPNGFMVSLLAWWLSSSSGALITSLVDPHLRALEHAGRNREIKAVVLSHLPNIGAGARADRGRDLGQPFI